LILAPYNKKEILDKKIKSSIIIMVLSMIGKDQKGGRLSFSLNKTKKR